MRLGGELGGAHIGHPDLNRAQAPGSQPFTVDAGALREFDTSVLAVLLDASRTCQSRGSRLAIANPPAKLSQLAALYGVDGLLGLSPD